MLEVYFADVSGLDPDREYPLSPYRREKLKRQKNVLAQKQGLGAELLLIKALEAAAPELLPPLDISCGKDGKPELVGGGIFFNLSHSDNYAACAVSDSSIGLDIQAERDFNKGIAEKYFTEPERRFFEESENKAYAFTKLWSMKESAVKYIGTGLKTPLTSFSVDSEKGEALFCGQRLFFHHSIIDGCHLALCSGDCAAVREIKINEVKLLP